MFARILSCNKQKSAAITYSESFEELPVSHDAVSELASPLESHSSATVHAAADPPSTLSGVLEEAAAILLPYVQHGYVGDGHTPKPGFPAGPLMHLRGKGEGGEILERALASEMTGLTGLLLAAVI